MSALNNGEGPLLRIVVGATRLFSKNQDSEEYKQISLDEEESGRIGLAAPSGYDPEFDDESGPDAGVNEKLLEGLGTAVKRQRKTCCTRCGLAGMLLGLAILILGAWLFFKPATWSAKPLPTGLEDMPKYSESLGCADTPLLYGNAEQTYTVPIGTKKNDHYLNIRGGAVGTIFVTPGSGEYIIIKASLRSDDSSLLENIVVDQHDPAATSDSYWRLLTPTPSSGLSCLRYDLTVFLPPGLKKLHIATHAVSHIRIDDENDFGDAGPLEDLFITFFSPRADNIFLPSAQLAAERATFEMVGGWMVGSVAQLEQTRILTQRGSARARVDVLTLPSGNSTAMLHTVTGTGRADIAYVGATPARPIQSDHLSTGNGDLHLHYERSGFRGRVRLGAQSWSVHGLHGAVLGAPQPDGEEDGASTEDLPWVGDKDGGDTMKTRSVMGWVGLYF